MYDLTIIIPTYNEVLNIHSIVDQLQSFFSSHSLNGEILIIDDNSPDGTITEIRKIQMSMPDLHLIVRENERGLSSAVVEGFRKADSNLFFVIDADGSHDLKILWNMYLLVRYDFDIVIGSRYVEHGGINGWPLKRRILSFGATFLGRLLVPSIHDPVSGFFAVRKSVVENAPLKPRGYKILLEILGKGNWKTYIEVPYTFTERKQGSSKLKGKVIAEYAYQVLDNYWYRWNRIIKFLIVGASGILINEGGLILLSGFIPLPVASAVSIELSILSNFTWNDRWTFQSHDLSFDHWYQRLALFQIVCVVGGLINFGILTALVYLVGIDYRIANLIGIALAFIWNYSMSKKVTWQKKS